MDERGDSALRRGDAEKEREGEMEAGSEEEVGFVCCGWWSAEEAECAEK